MRRTLLALLPGLLVHAWAFGPGIVLNVLFAALTAVLVELIMLKLARKPPGQIADGAAILTGVLLGLCLPPLLPLWMTLVGVAFAMIFGKHIYGGTGHNIFNPAMAGFAVLILSFPLAMSHWPAPHADHDAPGLLASKLSLTGARSDYDGVTAATPLDAYRLRQGITNDEFFATAQDNWLPWVYINLAFLTGGLYLLWRKIIPWQTPVAMLAALGCPALLFHDGGSSASLGSPLLHLFSGATMLAAFFIVTDPVTCPGYRGGLLLFGAGVGAITFVIRSIGAYPEGIAFAVLLMNAASPLIDRLPAARA